MLGSFMEEMQITPEQFELACLEGRQNTAAGSAFSFHQGLFQQVRQHRKHSKKLIISTSHHHSLGHSASLSYLSFSIK